LQVRTIRNYRRARKRNKEKKMCGRYLAINNY
jgi:hypothetical protein